MTDITTENAFERQDKWEPIAGIVTPAASAVIAEDEEGLTVFSFDLRRAPVMSASAAPAITKIPSII